MEQQQRHCTDRISVIDILTERHELVRAMEGRWQQPIDGRESERAEGHSKNWKSEL